MVKKVCLENGQHVANFLVGQNQKGGCRGGGVEKFATVSWFKRLTVVVAKG